MRDNADFIRCLSGPQENLSLFPTDFAPGEDRTLFHEMMAMKAGYRLVAGLDEAGRGPLAGPVVAAAVILPRNVELEGVRDSKQMSARARETAFELINRRARAVAIAVVSKEYIDQFNILRASLEAMKRAAQALVPQPTFLLVDGINAVPLALSQKCLKKGDQRSLSISAASIMAKVYRDRIMKCYHARFPMYGFDQHKGYGTKRHLEALARFGPCPFHRLTFKGVCQIDQGTNRTRKNG
jgi:ribonuclease HII